VDGILGHNLLLSQAFSVGIPSWMGFYAFAEPFSQTLFLFHRLFFVHDIILAIKEPFSRTFLLSRWNSGYQGAFLMNFSFFTMELWLSRSLSHELFFFHDGILAIKEPFSRTFLFSRWNSGYQGAFHTNFSFFTMEFWLSRSLSHELFFFHDGTFLFSQWNSGYQGAFHTNFSFSRWNSGYQGAFLTNFSFFTMEFWLSRSLSHELFFFHDGILKIRALGEDSFHIYHKEYLHRIRLIKNLAS
jgi:hypothetical protein